MHQCSIPDHVRDQNLLSLHWLDVNGDEITIRNDHHLEHAAYMTKRIPYDTLEIEVWYKICILLNHIGNISKLTKNV